MTPKEALIKDGFPGVKPGRGRLSREAIERCKVLAGQGQRIDGYVVSATPALAAKPTAAPVVNKVAVTNEKVIESFTILYDRDAYDAVDEKGKKWGMANACNNCRVSLVQCHCGKPTIFGNIAVVIRARA